jgi:hypothetical protein
MTDDITYTLMPTRRGRARGMYRASVTMDYAKDIAALYKGSLDTAEDGSLCIRDANGRIIAMLYTSHQISNMMYDLTPTVRGYQLGLDDCRVDPLRAMDIAANMGGDFYAVTNHDDDLLYMEDNNKDIIATMTTYYPPNNHVIK